MKLSMMINYSGDFHADVQKVCDLENAGLDLVWVPEAYSFDAVSQLGYLAAKTSKIEIGTGIINVRCANCSWPRLRQRRSFHPWPWRLRSTGHRGFSRSAIREADGTHP